MERKPRIAIPFLAGAERLSYSEVLAALGAEPVHISVPAVEGFDALLLPGGGDVEPSRYGQELNGSQEPNTELDALQFDMLQLFLAAGKPVFGICRGHQLINIYFGGTLIQDLPNAVRHKRDPETLITPIHANTAGEGFIRDLYGAEFVTNSSHHQAVDRLGSGLHAVQYSDDGVLEAMYHESLPVWSVQWHPEMICLGNARPDTVDGAVVLSWWLDVVRKSM